MTNTLTPSENMTRQTETLPRPQTPSEVERIAQASSPYELLYPPVEKIPTVIVPHFPMLGKMTALRFLEWAQDNPGGVISLPTGKTPEYFIKWVMHFLGGWTQPDVQKDLAAGGVDPDRRPDMKSLHFVQIDEFYPIDSRQKNSFYYYVKKYYLQDFGLDLAKALLINPNAIGLFEGESLQDVWPDNYVDLTLRYRQPKSHAEERQKALLEAIDQWCMEYEEKVRSLGGIGFFLGGIGPDGHIGFNIRGSDHFSTTRLCPINYETQAAAAGDLGGIETARKSHVITIGLRTITANPDCVAVIMAAGEAKAEVVARAIQSERTVDSPATALQALPYARFYLTQGAAKHLTERRYHDLQVTNEITDAQVEQILVDMAWDCRKQLVDLDPADFQSNRLGQVLLDKRNQSITELCGFVRKRIEDKIQKGMDTFTDACFLHTEPHHDDVMLGYFSYLVRHFRHPGNTHYFMTLTSGFTAVTNRFMMWQVGNLRQFLQTDSCKALVAEEYFDADNPTARNRDVWQYLDGVAAGNADLCNEGRARRFLRNLLEINPSRSVSEMNMVVNELTHYFDGQYPGAADTPEIQKLKGMSREWEAECLWGYYGWNCDHVIHSRLGFYTGDIFTPQPTMQRDVLPIVQHFEQIQPDIITVALDPEASGPDTHYKVLQALAEALRLYQEKSGRRDIQVWGYRNVWYRFEPSEANVFVPVSLNMFAVMHQSFMNAFQSQKEASFPSYEHDGPFSELAQHIQVQQYQKLKTCLGREWFYDHPSPLIRATRGFQFLREMEPEEFYTTCRQLKQTVEAV